MFTSLKAEIASISKGLALVLLIAMSSNFLSFHYNAPVILFALLIGIAFNFLNNEKNCKAGIEFASGTILRMGVALLGLKLTLSDIQSIGYLPVIALIILVILTFGFGTLLSYIFGRKLAFGLLAGGSVAICGASAALAIASVLPFNKNRTKDVLFVVIGVTILSTVSMIIYPILFKSLGMNEIESGYLIGATIHDIAQVVGAGYSISEESGIIATLIKMIRVTLLPIVMILVMYTLPGSQNSKVTLPWFISLFIFFAVIRNIFNLPEFLIYFTNEISIWFIIIAISALGIKTNLYEFSKVSYSYSIILILETLFLLIAALIMINILDI